MRLIKPLPVTGLLCLLLVLSCQSKNEMELLESNKKDILLETPKEEDQVYAVDTVAQVVDRKENKQFQPVPKPDWDKKIIKNATLNVEVKDYKIFSNTIREITKKAGGYIAREDQQQSEYKLENSITIKVPVDQFDEAINSLTASPEKIIEKKIGSEDVTGEIIDTRSRMEAKKQVRLRYLDLLKQAKNMEEILQVQSEIDDIQVQIESATGRVQYLNHAAALSTIQLTYFQVLNPTAVDKGEPSFGTRLIQSLKDGASWVGELMIIVMSLWPLWMAGLIAWVFFRKYRLTKTKAA